MPRRRILLMSAIFVGYCASGLAQQPGQNSAVPAKSPLSSPPPAGAVAATVNGQAIPEIAVYRAIGKKAVQSKQIRDEVVNYLIDNVLVDMYLDQWKITVDAREIDAQVQKVKDEITKSGNKLDQVFNELYLTEAELRTQVNATLRWEKFIKEQATDKTLREYYDTNKAIFDGSAIRVKHILISAPPGNAEALEQAKTRVALLKKQIEDQVAQGMTAAGKLDNLEMQKRRMQLTGERFAALATTESSCDTKSTGGELGWFPRSGGGRVPETFARAAFTLKPWEMSNAVVTEVGVHLILCVDFRAGTEQRFEDIRGVVKDYYADKMREGISQMMRDGRPGVPKVKIVVNPAPK
jgi:peptidyl-prolyl cis-trans isomerase C